MNPQPLKITPHFNATSETFTRTWAGIVNIDQFKWLSWSKVHDALEMARDELGTHTVRAVGMYGYASRVFDQNPEGFSNPDKEQMRTNFSMLQTYFDGCIERGVTPMFTTCFTPEVMASGGAMTFDHSCNMTHPMDLDTWKQFVAHAVREMAHRYGKPRMREWLFEVWNEPNLEDSFWCGGQELWFELWRHTYEAIKSVDADFRVGGPSTARGEWIRELLDYGKDQDCVPDYIISHCYNNDADGEGAALSPFHGQQLDRTSKSPNFLKGVIRGVHQICEDFGFTGEIHWNEWGRSWFPCDHERETANEAAFIFKTMAEVSHLADSFAYWCLSDIYNQKGYGRETFHGNYGMLNQQNIRKPSYLAHQLLCRFKEYRYEVTVENGSDLINAISAGDESTRQVAVYGFRAPEGGALASRRVEVCLESDAPFHRPKLFRLTDKENNVVQRWKDAGAEPYMTSADGRRWEASSVLQEAPLAELQITSHNGRRVVSFELNGCGVAFLEWHTEPFEQPLIHTEPFEMWR